MVPKFEEMAFTLPVGSISPVFETPYGFNVVKVLERRSGAVATWEEVKPQLLRMIGDQQRNQMIEAKVASLRPVAKIEILSAAYREAPAPAPSGAAPSGTERARRRRGAAAGQGPIGLASVSVVVVLKNRYPSYRRTDALRGTLCDAEIAMRVS